MSNYPDGTHATDPRAPWSALDATELGELEDDVQRMRGRIEDAVTAAREAVENLEVIWKEADAAYTAAYEYESEYFNTDDLRRKSRALQELLDESDDLAHFDTTA